MATKELTVRELQKRHTALSIIGNRFAPSIKADIRIAKYLGPVSRAMEPYDKLKSKAFIRVAEDNGLTLKDAEKMSGIAQQLLAAKVQEAQQEMESELIKVELPDWCLTQDDLPKERESNKDNGAQLGAIIADLGDFFEYPKE